MTLLLLTILGSTFKIKTRININIFNLFQNKLGKTEAEASQRQRRSSKFNLFLSILGGCRSSQKYSLGYSPLDP
jgi:hypothetical protein